MKNIRLAYAIKFFVAMNFWLPVWALYYLLFTDYAGISILEAVWVLFRTFFEIPTGALADILGKKKTLIIGAIFSFLALVLLGLAGDFSVLFFSMIVFAFADALRSGSFDAFVYDSLVDAEREKDYPFVVSNLRSIELFSMAIGSILGAIMFGVDPRLPFLLTGVTYLCVIPLLMFSTEPSVDTEEFSWRGYKSQLFKGFDQLFGDMNFGKVVFFLFMFWIFMTFSYEVLNDLILVDFGFDEKYLGIIYAIGMLLAGVFSRISSRVSKPLNWIIFSGFIFGVFYIILPAVGMWFAVVFMYIRSFLYNFSMNLRDQVLNQGIDAKYRATALSTFSAMVVFGYGVLILLVGPLIELFSPVGFGFRFGIVLCVFIMAVFFIRSLKLFGRAKL